MSSYFSSTLQYSSCLEDLEAELCGLQVSPDDDVLAIAGGGGRAIGLLAQSPRKVVAIDYNPLQCLITRIKAFAISAFDYQEFLVFMGLKGTPADRQHLWRRCEDQHHLRLLPRRNRVAAAKRGLLYCGLNEQHFASYGAVLRAIFGNRFEMMFNSQTLEEQVMIWRQIRDATAWRALSFLGTHPAVFRLFLQNSGWYQNVDKGFNVGQFVLGEIDRFLSTTPARQSHLLQLVLCGRYLDDCTWPHYLQEKYYELIRQNIDRLSVVHAGVVDYLEDPATESVSRYSLSNVFAYLTTDDANRLFHCLVRRGKSRPSRIVARQFLSVKEPPGELYEAFNRDLPLEKRLYELDSSLVYRFFVANLP